MTLLALQVQRFGAGGDSYVHPLIAVAVLIVAALLIALPRKHIIVPLLAGAILVPLDQIIIVGGLHFQMIRVLILAGWIRLIIVRASSGNQVLSGGIKSIDYAVIFWSVFTAVDTLLLWQNSAALINQLGALYTVFGIYFLLRFLLRDAHDVVNAIKGLAYICAFVAIVMTIEQVTGHNPYAYVWAGAVEGGRTVMERDGHFRAMACFAHPLLAGTFGGISMPLFFALWWKEKSSRKSAVIGILASTIIIWAANSSSPLLAYAGGFLAICLWPLRRRMRVLRWALVITLTALHLVMKAPVWALIARIDLTGSSSGYHRYQLVDQFIQRFGDWWLLGTKSNGDWGWDMWDLANQYVAVGETSGLLPFLCFIAIIVFGFKYIGKARKAAHDRTNERLIWALGAALFANVVAFFGISYYDQTMVAWYLLLAMIPSACASVALAKQKEHPVIEGELPIRELAYAAPAGAVAGLTELLTKDRPTLHS